MKDEIIKKNINFKNYFNKINNNQNKMYFEKNINQVNIPSSNLFPLK